MFSFPKNIFTWKYLHLENILHVAIRSQSHIREKKKSLKDGGNL